MCGTLAFAAPGLAQAQGDEEARALFGEASEAYQMGRFDEALSKYEAAYKLKKLPGFLFNMAQCHYNLGNHDRAVFLYESYLDSDPPAERRAVAGSTHTIWTIEPS